jgi:uncharacterized protein
MHKYFYFLLIQSFLFFPLFSLKVESIFGEFEEEDALVIELIESPIMERLKDIHQHGVPYYVGGVPSFTRFKHSLGVYHLLKKFDVKYEECLAGLVHDTSHTVFSHLGDFIYPQTSVNEAYQDQIVDWWLIEQNLEDTLKKYKLTLEDISPKNELFVALETDIPDICADRIEYLCHTAYVFKMMDKEDIKKLISDLRYENGTWYFENTVSAKKLAMLSLYFTENFWGTTWNYVVNHYFSIAVKGAMEFGEVSFNDIHFSTDQKVLAKIENSHCDVVKRNFEKCRLAHLLAEEVSNSQDGDFDFLVKTKFRGIDPYIKVEESLKRLSQLDEDYKKYFEKIKIWTDKRVKVKMLTPTKRVEGVISI